MNTQDPTTPAGHEPVIDTAKQAWDTTKQKAGEAIQNSERYVREHPGTSALSIFGLGFGLGMLIGWSMAHEERDNYTDTARRFAKRWGGKLHFD